MVVGIALGAVTGIMEALTRTAAAPFLDLAQQEVSKAFPVIKPDLEVERVNFLRGQITEEEYLERAARKGFDEENARRILFSKQFFPGPSDQVRFVVKEGYTPEIIQDLTKGEETPQKFIDEIIKLGGTKEIADLFWITHYDPLGRRDFEEMFQRLHPDQLAKKEELLKTLNLRSQDVKFESDDLKRMYRILDIYPGLRDRLNLVSYKPISRIDLRRLEDFGVVPDSELVFGNREFGYSPQDSDKLALWTRVNNDLKDIRPQIKDGTTGIEEAIQILVNDGLDLENATRLINRIRIAAKKDRAAKLRDTMINEILKAVKNGKMTETEARPDLLALEMDNDEINAVFEVARIVEKGDPENKKEADRAVNLIRKMEGKREVSLGTSKRQLSAFAYTVELQGEKKEIVDRVTRIKYDINDTFIDLVTGREARVIRKKQTRISAKKL